MSKILRSRLCYEIGLRVRTPTLNLLEQFKSSLWLSFQDVEKEVIAAVLGQGLLESERLVHLLDDLKIRPEAPPNITCQVPWSFFGLFLECIWHILAESGKCCFSLMVVATFCGQTPSSPWILIPGVSTNKKLFMS